MWFSRHREYRADEGSATYVGKEKMIAALESLKKQYILQAPNEKFATMQIASPSQNGWKFLFQTHPSLDSRIENLEKIRM
jgi:heat shock protein HtpX